MKQKVKKFDQGDFVTLDSPFAQTIGVSGTDASSNQVLGEVYDQILNAYGGDTSQAAFEQAAQADVDSNWFSDFAESLLPGDMTYEDLAQYAEYGGEITKGLGAGVTQMGAGVLTGLAELLPEEYEESVQTGIGDFAEQIIADYLAPGEGYEDSALRTYSEAVGSTLPYLIPGGAIVRGAQVGAGMAGQAGEAATRAIEAGATPEQKDQATALASVMGAFETVLGPGKAIDKLIPGQAGQEFVTDIAEVVTNNILNKGAKVTAATIAEGLEEAGQEAGQNAIQKYIYDPTQELGEGVFESAEVGAGAGAIVQTAIELLTPGKTRSAAYIPASDTTAVSDAEQITDQTETGVTIEGETTVPDSALLTGTVISEQDAATSGQPLLTDGQAIYDQNGRRITPTEGKIYTFYEDGSVAV